MQVIEHLAKAKDTLVSFEVLPPLKGKTIAYIYEHLDPLMEFKPSWINVTYHRSETIIRTNAAGVEEKVDVRKRPGTVGICAAIMNHYNVDAVPHIICGGFSKRETEDALIDLQFLGIDNVLALRGDSIKTEPAFVPEPDGNKYAVDLVKQIVELNKGAYQDEEIRQAAPTEYCIGVAGYPEKHFEAPNMNHDLRNLKAKVDEGADYIVTQLFYDNEKFFAFVKACREMGITVPIIPGLKPITLKKQVVTLPKFFHIDIPVALAEAFEKAKTDEQCKEIGIEWSIQQSNELIKFGVPCLHYYTMGKSDAVKRIASGVF